MSEVFGALPTAGDGLLGGAIKADIGYLAWGMLHDADLEYARSLMADLNADQDLRHEAAMRRSKKLRAIGSQATFFSGLARIDGALRSVRVAVTPQEFVLFDNWTHADPEGELASLPREASRKC